MKRLGYTKCLEATFHLALFDDVSLPRINSYKIVSVIGGRGTPFCHLQFMAHDVVRFFCNTTGHTATDRS